MGRFTLVRIAAGALVAVALSASPLRAATPGIPAFYVDYNQNCTFTMSVDPGTPLPPSGSVTLPPGTYQLLISMMNPSAGYAPCSTPTFTLTGPGVSILIAFAGVELHEERVFTAQPSAAYVAQDENSPARRVARSRPP